MYALQRLGRAQYSLSPLTVLVNLDGQGKASGRLYHDAGDGYTYRQGQYALFDLRADAQGSKVTVTITRKTGQYQVGPVSVQVELLTSSGIRRAGGDLDHPIVVK